jgi:hypothetical protein
MPNPQENAIETHIRYQVLDEAGLPKDIGGATVKQLIFGRPNKTTFTVNATLFTNGADGILQYITVDGDLVPYGRYQVQANLVMPGFNGRTGIATFPVQKNIP